MTIIKTIETERTFLRQLSNDDASKHGLTNETAIKCLDYGLNELNLKKIIARVRVENIASIRVLEKSGMTFKETFLFDGCEGLIYEKHKL